MPNKTKNITPVSSPQLPTPSGSHSVSSNSGRSMPPTTRSMQGRLPNTSPSLPYVQVGASRSTTQQAPSQRATHATSADVVSSDDDEASEEDDEEDEEEDDDDDEDEDEEDEVDGSGDEEESDEEDDIKTKVFKIFAVAEPNGLTESEIRSTGYDASKRFRSLVKVVADEAETNLTFRDTILGIIQVPSNAWGKCMYDQLRTRLDVTVARFDRGSSSTSNRFDVVNTSTQLEGLIRAIESMTTPGNWRPILHPTTNDYFGLLLDVVRCIVARDRDHRGAGSKSGSSSPYAVNPVMNYNLYQRMVGNSHCRDATESLARLVRRLKGPLGPGLPDQIRALLDAVKTKDRSHSTTESQTFVGSLRRLRDAIPGATPPCRSRS